MMAKLKFALVVSIASHAEMRWLHKKGAAGKPLKKVWYTVRRSGVVASAQVVLAVDHARESARIMKDVAGNLQENVRATVNKSGVNVNLFLLYFDEFMSW